MNNHIGNYGTEAVTETEKILDDNKILWSGFSNLAIKEAKGKRFGFLGYNGIGVKIDREAMASEIKESKAKVDVLVISIHWGKEYESTPLTDGNIAPDDPVEIGHLMIDSGADLIVGNHPHWVQGVEIFKDKFIAYAHGNFIFDQTWSEETQEGVVGVYTFYEGKLIAVKYKPIVVDKSYQPVFVGGTRAIKILKQMQDSSIQLAK
jgi:poly-gamma-glutamate synthesis protein (capsule biosynthesis protein)